MRLVRSGQYGVSASVIAEGGMDGTSVKNLRAAESMGNLFDCVWTHSRLDRTLLGVVSDVPKDPDHSDLTSRFTKRITALATMGKGSEHARFSDIASALTRGLSQHLKPKWA